MLNLIDIAKTPKSIIFHCAILKLEFDRIWKMSLCCAPKKIYL